MTNDLDLAIAAFVTPVDLVFVRRINHVTQIAHYIGRDTALYDYKINAQNRSIRLYEMSNAFA